MSDEISNTQDVIDTRDVIERMGNLQGWIDDAEEEARDKGGYPRDYDEEYDDYCTELGKLERLAEECAGTEFRDGETLVHYDYFTQYVEEFVQDIGALPSNLPHWIDIDWESTAANVMGDYTEANFDGETYLIRSV